MARYNEILVGRYNRLVQKLFSMKGGAALSTVSDEMLPVLPFFHGVENRYLEGWDRFATRDSNPAVLGQFGVFQLRNPAGSNVMAVVEKIVFLGNALQDPYIYLAPQAAELLTPQDLPVRIDPRGRPKPSLRWSRQNQVASLVGVTGQWSTAANSASVEAILTEHQEIPILPGDALQLANDVANTVFVVSVWWRERYLEDSERA